MNRLILCLGTCLFVLLAASLSPVEAKSLPPYPFQKERQPPSSIEKEKARELFELTRRENTRLDWDDCLASKAFNRAKNMVQRNYFHHKDPKRGENPAWNLVATCFSCKVAGENLAQGYKPSEEIHQAWMDSPTHRKNILDRRFSLVGIGCYDYICVQLFAGF